MNSYFVQFKYEYGKEYYGKRFEITVGNVLIIYDEQDRPVAAFNSNEWMHVRTV